MMYRATVILVVAALASPVFAQQQPELDPVAQKHLDEGLEAYAKGKFDVAVSRFEAAYHIDPNPVLLYAWAQAERKRNNCDRAHDLYQKYIDSKPTEAQIKAARTGMELCPRTQPAGDGDGDDKAGDGDGDGGGGAGDGAGDGDRTASTTGPPDPDPDPTDDVAPPPITAPPPEISKTGEATPWYKDPLGDALTIGGAVGIGVGASFLVLSRSSQNKADDAEFRDDFERHLDDATTRRRIGGVALGVGAALVAGGIVRYLLRDDGSGSVSVAAGAGGVTLGGTF